MGAAAVAWWKFPAVYVIYALREGLTTPVEVLASVRNAYERVEGPGGALNSMPITAFDAAASEAAALTAAGFPEDPPPGYLYGLPVVVKDLNAKGGVRFTSGVRKWAERVPAASDAFVGLIEERGGIVIGKSNTPELGAGSQTFNDLFGKTRNPFDLRRTAGGSSGGSAAAVATFAHLATGTDLGGSLRMPAAYCSVVGLRCSPGLVLGSGRQLGAWHGTAHSVNGPMARDVLDASWFLDTMATGVALPRRERSGWRAVLAMDTWDRAAEGEGRAGSGSFAATVIATDALVSEGEGEGEGEAAAWRYPPAYRRLHPTAAAAAAPPRRFAFAADVGLGPVDAATLEAYRALLGALRRLRVGLEPVAVDAEAALDLSDAPGIFRALRSRLMADALGGVVAEEEVKPELWWNIRDGDNFAEGSAALRGAVSAHRRLLERVDAFFDGADVLLMPVVACRPFDVDVRYPVAGDYALYTSWMAYTSATTLANCPSAAVPCGRLPNGMPVGIQVLVASPEHLARRGGAPVPLGAAEHRLVAACRIVEIAAQSLAPAQAPPAVPLKAAATLGDDLAADGVDGPRTADAARRQIRESGAWGRPAAAGDEA